MRPSLRRGRPRRSSTGKKPGGKPPSAAGRRAVASDQINLTDEDSRIMPVAGGGFEQCYNAQAVVAEGSLLVVAAEVVQAPNDKQQLGPMVDKLIGLAGRAGTARDAVGRQRLLQRCQCRCLRKRPASSR